MLSLYLLEVAGQTGIGASVAPACIPQSLPDPSVTQDPLHGKKLGVYWDWFTDAAPDVVDTCKATLNEMCKSGAEVTNVDMNITQQLCLLLAYWCLTTMLSVVLRTVILQ